MINSVTLVGRLTKDITLNETQNRKIYARFTLAVNDKEKTYFISCLAWEHTAKYLEKYAKKGFRIGLEGHIETGEYTNKNNQKVYTTDIVCNKVDILESKPNSNSRPNDLDDYMIETAETDITSDDLPF